MLLASAPSLAAEPEARASDAVWTVVVSPWTQHYIDSPEYKAVWALGLERETSDHTLYGLALFSNSYGQPSAYAYYGRVYSKVDGWPESLYLKLTAGVIYGYVKPYEEKMLVSYQGFAPVIVPGIGWQLDPNWSVQTDILGTVALMFSLNRRL